MNLFGVVAQCSGWCRSMAAGGMASRHPVHRPSSSPQQHAQTPAPCPLPTRRSFIGRGEIEETLRSGRINTRKSQPALRPCPKYTVDAALGPRRKNVQVSARLLVAPPPVQAGVPTEQGALPVAGASEQGGLPGAGASEQELGRGRNP